jgi:chemotaxis signal transduction protein
MPQTDNCLPVDIGALKAQVDAEIAARLLVEADSARHIHRRGFRVGELNLLVELDMSSEVAEMPPLYRLPGAPNGIKGIANRHGRVIPVMDLSILFALQNRRTANQWLLVCGRGDAAVGLVIDSLPERKIFVQHDTINLQDVASPMAAYAKAAYGQGNDVWIDLDVQTFFAAVFGIELAAV